MSSECPVSDLPPTDLRSYGVLPGICRQAQVRDPGVHCVPPLVLLSPTRDNQTHKQRKAVGKNQSELPPSAAEAEA